ncbi:MAG TPA: type II secretion system protein [Tepidisphaeraceae bacterium]|nr:type II secretion system protein [Tepidisphaeraceae bacterium]
MDIANNTQQSKGAAVGKCRKGFTTIELIVAITILVLLMGMVMVGFGVVGNRGKATDTQVALEAAKSMLAELDASRNLVRVKDLFLDSSKDYYQLGINAPEGRLTGDPESDDEIRRRTVWTAPGNSKGSTANVMKQLYSMPNNRKMLEALPARRAAQIPLRRQPREMILLDGWNNPIIFVPAGGLRGCMDAKTDSIGDPVITSAGVIQNDTAVPLPGGAHGFFVSAGPDGLFTTHQDNVYSFEN